ncbi:MAG TPA: hypothetical protein VHQ64_17845, partial [Pyrinomonadaceae bacterium]|nr:hypothetical protein [Pyrinomonadaceae bacterium]
MLCIVEGHGVVIEIFEACSVTEGLFPANSFAARTGIITGASKADSKTIGERLGYLKRLFTAFQHPANCVES